MTLHEFVAEMREVYQIFDKQNNDAYNKRLFTKVESLDAHEFRAIKSRVLDECDFFPRLSKWQALKEWIISKRTKKERVPCNKCSGEGMFEALCLQELYSDEWEQKCRANNFNHDKYIETIGRKTLGEHFYFRCPCENGINYGQRALVLWRDEFNEFYIPIWNFEYTSTKANYVQLRIHNSRFA